MSAIHTVRSFLVVVLMCLIPAAAYAGGWGKGLRIAGYHPSDPGHPIIPAKPLDGLKDAVNDTGHAIDVNSKGTGKIATATWNAVKRPFVETWKFLSDPTAGLRRKTGEIYNQVLTDATNLAYKIVEWASVGFGIALAFSIGLAMGLAALLFKPRRRRRAQA